VLSMGDRPLLMEPDKTRPAKQAIDQRLPREERTQRRNETGRLADSESERFRIEVGHEHGVKPGNIVGAIANEAGLESRHIGRIDINDTFSLIDLPVGMPADVFSDLKKVRVCGQPLNISRADGFASAAKGRSHPPPKHKDKKKPAAGVKAKSAGKKGKGKPNAGLPKPAANRDTRKSASKPDRKRTRN